MSAIVVNKGEGATLTVDLERDNAPVDLTGATLRFIALYEQGDSPTESAFEKAIGSGITVTDAPGGVATVTIEAADVQEFEPFQLLFYRVILNTGAGDELIDTGTIRVVEEIAQETYITVEHVRAAGIGEDVTDQTIREAIRTWQSFIERVCRQWFYPREMEFYFEAPNSTLVHFGVPIITVHELRLHNAASPLDPSAYTLEGMSGYPDRRHNPCIRLLGEGSHSIYAQPVGFGPIMIQRGRHFIRGVFGYVEDDGAAPPLIKRALLKLVIEKVARPVYQGGGGIGIAPPPLIQGALREEWTDDHRMKFDPPGGALRSRAPGLTGITSDIEILDILRLYRAPIGIATPGSRMEYR